MGKFSAYLKIFFGEEKPIAASVAPRSQKQSPELPSLLDIPDGPFLENFSALENQELTRLSQTCKTYDNLFKVLLAERKTAFILEKQSKETIIVVYDSDPYNPNRDFRPRLRPEDPYWQAHPPASGLPTMRRK